MRFFSTPAPLFHLITAILLTPHRIAANPHPPGSALAGFSYNQLFARYDCSGELCGYYKQLCCTAGSACYTNAKDQAECTATSSKAAGGHWATYTTVTVTDKETVTTTYTSYISSSTAKCNYALNETPCGDICCTSSQYCAKLGQCKPAYKGQTTTTVTTGVSAVPPVRGTSKSNVVVTQTESPTTTVPFETPVATGANVTMTETVHHGLSGGAIAGIVIGVLVGVLILALICFYCCLKGLLDGCLALFGLGKRRRRVTEVDEYTRRSHHSSGGGRRTWYGAAPTRVKREERRESNLGRDLLGIGGGLAALWAILGLKRQRENRRRTEVEKSEYSYSSDYYTSESSASSDDRRTERYSRHSVRRSDSRRP